MSVESELTEMKDDFKEHQTSDANYFNGFTMELKDMKLDIKGLRKDVNEIKVANAEQSTDLKWISQHLKKNDFVRKEEFKPIKSIVYGGTGLILASFLGTVIYYIGWR